MLHIRRLVLYLFYFVPVIWFMYVSVELLAERSSSLAAMELAYRLHQEQNHAQSRDVLPAETRQDHAPVLPGVVKVEINPKNQVLLHHSLESQRQKGEEEEENQADVYAVVKLHDRESRVRIIRPALLPLDEQGKEEPVQFPPYVERWGPGLPGELSSADDRSVVDF